MILVHSRTHQLSIHTGHIYFGKSMNRKGLSTSLHNENESAKMNSYTNELSTLCWNFTVFIIPSLLPVQRQFLLHSRTCYSDSVTAEQCCPHSSPFALCGSTGRSLPCRIPAQAPPSNRTLLCPGKADIWVFIYVLVCFWGFFNTTRIALVIQFPLQSFANNSDLQKGMIQKAELLFNAPLNEQFHVTGRQKADKSSTIHSF